MIELLLIAALAWPAECEVEGDLYRQAAEVRDSGITKEVALSKVASPRVRLALIHVFDRPDMSAQEWRYFMVGICMGTRRGGAVIRL